MNNLITVFMNYKVNRLVAYAKFMTENQDDFVQSVFREYFQTYVDNYYYHVFHTIDDDEEFSIDNLKKELKGIMEEMLYDYRSYEFVVSNEEYQSHCKAIRELNPICFEIIKIDALSFDSKDDVSVKINSFLDENTVLNDLVKDRRNKLISLVRETYQNSLKLLNYEENYYQIEEYHFEGKEDKVFYKLVPSIKALEVYRTTTIYKVYQHKDLGRLKTRCLIQKVSFFLLKNVLEKKKIPLIFIEFSDTVFHRGKIDDEIFDLIDNPLFRRYVIIGVSFPTYQAQEGAFVEDYQFACIQDFSHISDVYQKTDSIRQEGVFRYLIVSDCKYANREYFLGYHNESMEVLVFEEE